MAEVTIRLSTYNTSFILQRQAIQDFLPKSLFAQALSEDPNATVIDITNPVVTPKAMQTILDYTRGIEPIVANPELVAVDRYLNIPWLKYYADPLYNEIRQPVNVHRFTKWKYLTPEDLADTNWPVLMKALNGHPAIVEYFRQKWFDLGGALIYAVWNNLDEANDILRLMLTPYSVDRNIIDAAIENEDAVIRNLMSGDSPQTTIDAVALIAAYSGSTRVLRWILQGYDFLSPSIRHDVGRALVIWRRIHSPYGIIMEPSIAEYMEWLVNNQYI
jgi:hypothetical protein